MTPRTIGKARNARLNQTIRHVRALADLLDSNQGTPHHLPVLDADMWEQARELVGQISRCFHEANAYNNALAANGTRFERNIFQVPT